MQRRGVAGESGTFTVEQFEEKPKSVIEQSLARGRVVIDAGPDEGRYVISVRSANDLDDDD